MQSIAEVPVLGRARFLSFPVLLSVAMCASAGSVFAETPGTTLPKTPKHAHPRVIDMPPERFSAQDPEGATESDVPNYAASVPRSAISPHGAASAFDPVPEKYRDSIAERLRITAELVRLGRAYDYRSKTTAEMRTILEGLQKPAAVAHKPALTPEEQIPTPPAPPSLDEIEIQIE